MKVTLVLLFIIILSFDTYSQRSNNYLTQKWKYVAHNDPYYGNDITSVDTTKLKTTIEFTSNGDYFYKDNWNNEIYRWKWNDDSTKIGIALIKNYAGNYPDRNIDEFNLSIIMLTRDSLIIGQQGRHGICRAFYIPYNN
jgi:hypothetical protein